MKEYVGINIKTEQTQEQAQGERLEFPSLLLSCKSRLPSRFARDGNAL